MTVLVGLIPVLFLAVVALAFVGARAAYRRQAAVDNEMRGAWAKSIGALPIPGPARLDKVIETMTKATSPPTKPEPETVEQFLARGGKIQTIVGYPNSEGRVVPRAAAPNASNAAQIPLRYP